MLMAVGPVHVAVGDLFLRGTAHIDHPATEAQRLPGQWVVAVQMHLGALDFHHRESAGIAFGIPPLDLTANFDAGRELGFGNGLLQGRVKNPKRIFRTQVNRDLVACALPFQRRLDFWKNVAVAAMQISQRLLALFEYFPLGVGQLEMDGDGTVFGNEHEKPPVFEGLIIGSSGTFPDNHSFTAFSRIFRLGASMSDTQQRIDSLVKSNDVVLFMKGTASFPQCGFSGRAIQILKGCGLDGKTIATVNVLEDQEVRQGIKEYSNWPTIPQLYVKGEFIGGSDIMTEMYESGELQKVIAGDAA